MKGYGLGSWVVPVEMFAGCIQGVRNTQDSQSDKLWAMDLTIFLEGPEHSLRALSAKYHKYFWINNLHPRLAAAIILDNLLDKPDITCHKYWGFWTQ